MTSASAVSLLQTGPPRCRGLFLEYATPAVLCHREPARRIKSWFFMAIRAPIIGPHSVSRRLILVREIGTAATELTQT